MTAQNHDAAVVDPLCPVHRAIGVLQEKWVLHIVRSLLSGDRGFNELARSVGGCNPATLAQRLDHLEKLGLIRKTVTSVMPPRTHYALTASGRELQGVIDAIDAWAREHLPKEDGAGQSHLGQGATVAGCD